MPDSKPRPNQPMSFGLFQREQRSLFGEILDWMLTPLLLLWPVGLALTWLVAQSIAGKPFDRTLEYNANALAQLVTVEQQQVRFSLPLPARQLLRSDDTDTVYYQVLGTHGEYLSGEKDLPAPRKTNAKHVIGVPGKQKAPVRWEPALSCRSQRSVAGLLLDEAAELVVEARNAAAAVHQLGVAAGPRRMGARVDVQRQGRRLPCVGRAGLVARTVGQGDGDEVVVGVGVGLHGDDPVQKRAVTMPTEATVPTMPIGRSGPEFSAR